MQSGISMIRSVASLLVMVALCMACAQDPAPKKGSYRAPVSDASRPPAPTGSIYHVKAGDTLYSIAWRYHQDYHELARINGLKAPYALAVGQRLAVRPGVAVPPPVVKPAPARVAGGGAPASQPVPAKSIPPVATMQKGSIAWQWPSRGKIIEYFSAQNGQKGIDIAGKNGQAVFAAAPGVVVYSGSGLRGYGQLVIIKHNEDYLSAYAHNSRLWVKEGDTVKAQAKIAEMGQTDTNSVRLHFEIRKKGQPVNPLEYLPR